MYFDMVYGFYPFQLKQTLRLLFPSQIDLFSEFAPTEFLSQLDLDLNFKVMHFSASADLHQPVYCLFKYVNCYLLIRVCHSDFWKVGQ